MTQLDIGKDAADIAVPDRAGRGRVFLLLGGALTGLLVAGADLVVVRSSSAVALPPDAIARVGNQLITRAQFERVARDLAFDKRTKAPGDMQFVLQRVIDEELLVQRGVELGFAETAPGIRKAIAAAVIAQIVTDAEAVAPTGAQLRRLYDDDAEFFMQSERLQVRWLRVRAMDINVAKRHAQTARDKLAAGSTVAQLDPSINIEVAAELPGELLPPAKLTDYMGPTLMRQARQLAPGEYSGPIFANDAYHILYVEASAPRRLPNFDDIKDVVETEYIRRVGEKALLDYLAWLRDRAQIVIDRGNLH